MKRINIEEDFQSLKKNLSQSKIIEQAILRGEGELGPNGSLMVKTGKYTGRCPRDRFLVENENSKDDIAWGKINQKISKENFNKILSLVLDYAKDHDFYLRDCYCGADAKYRINVRFITQKSWHSVFIYNMFIQSEQAEQNFSPDFTVIDVGDMKIKDHQKYGLQNDVFILFDFEQKLGIIGGTNYSGEMKKGIFSYMNYLLPFKGVFPMHCSANKSARGDVALFFGLSGTGKTTLSADTHRILIGDDEHGWSDDGIFNFEGGCYAKAINLNKKSEPTIWNAIQYGAILENVVYDEDSRYADFSDDSITENTRISYPTSLIENVDMKGTGGHPSNVIFLTADASGVLPPVAHLNSKQACYHFLSGYTSKVPGTESGVKEFQTTFSTCFGEPFMVLRPEVYSNLLEQKIQKHGCNVFLVNTGWFGGPFGTGSRISIQITRDIITKILEGDILNADFKKDDIFGFQVPQKIEGISENLEPQAGWESPEKYQQAKRNLAKKFKDNFARFQGKLPEIEKSGPQLN
jgi:phosphoenolpyruvate carboxykinase (ATP)